MCITLNNKPYSVLSIDYSYNNNIIMKSLVVILMLMSITIILYVVEYNKIINTIVTRIMSESLPWQLLHNVSWTWRAVVITMATTTLCQLDLEGGGDYHGNSVQLSRSSPVTSAPHFETPMHV